jgi:D-arabinose 1-dehydrogenase-like Zn-dependent alcohol dehydrogenase
VSIESLGFFAAHDAHPCLPKDDENMPLSGYLSLLRPGGNFILVGAPEKALPPINPFELIPKHVSVGGTMIVSRCFSCMELFEKY